MIGASWWNVEVEYKGTKRGDQVAGSTIIRAFGTRESALEKLPAELWWENGFKGTTRAKLLGPCSTSDLSFGTRVV
jgi:hypothetical protein